MDFLKKYDGYLPIAIATIWASCALFFMGPAGAGWAATSLAALIAMPPNKRTVRLSDLGYVYFATLIMQYLHIGEELLTGFATHFPEQMGFPAWSDTAYVIMTGANLLIVTLGIFPLAAGTRTGTYAACFLALLGIVNGVAHPILAIAFADGWYFSGMLTGIPHFFLGVWLWQTLLTKPKVRKVDTSDRIIPTILNTDQGFHRRSNPNAGNKVRQPFRRRPL